MQKRHIKRLDPSVANRIAAGEVVKRPANAVKEMIENSLDAGATSIQVLLKNGGMKYLQVIDNGIGISKEDLDIICERHTTSKIETIDDLQSVKTYGFRGEALSSISHVSHVSIKTKTADGRCGYEMSYIDGRPKGNPTPCGMNQGTQITVENMFYNIPIRQSALKNFHEEFKRTWDVVARYSVHNSSVGFSLKKLGQNDVNIKTTPGSTAKDVIGSLFGVDVSRNLLEMEGQDDTMRFKYKIVVTNLNYSATQMVFLLFVNHRLVKAEGLQKDITELYSIYLPRKTFPFVYISLEMPPGNVDVNIHPAKENVFYLHEEFINKKVVNSIQKLIMGKDAFKVYKEEALSLSQKESNQRSTSEEEVILGNDLEIVTKSDSHKKPRRERTDKVTENAPNFIELDRNISVARNEMMETDINTCSRIDTSPVRLNDSCKREGSSVLLLPDLGVLKKNIIDSCDKDLKSILNNSTFITCPSFNHMLVRNKDKLYMCNLKQFCQEYFYQEMINQFGRLEVLNISVPLPLMSLLCVVHSKQSHASEEDPNLLYEHLMQNTEVLRDFYGINVDVKGNLMTIPKLLKNYFPSKEDLPEFVWRLATQVSWLEKHSQIHEVCLQTAIYYTKFPSQKNLFLNLSEWNELVESTLFPNLKKDLLPSTDLSVHLTEILNITSFAEL